MHQTYHISDLLSLIDVSVSLTPQAVTSKSLPRIPVHKTSQPNSFGCESRGSLQAHTEARTACLTSASPCGEPKAITLVRS